MSRELSLSRRVPRLAIPPQTSKTDSEIIIQTSSFCLRQWLTRAHKVDSRNQRTDRIGVTGRLVQESESGQKITTWQLLVSRPKAELGQNVKFC